MQWLILYSHQNDDVLNVEIPVDQIGQNTKNELLPHKMSHTHHL